jgi:acetyltransferase EpsM
MKKIPHSSTPIVVLGAGGTGLYIADCIHRANGFKFAGFLDDDEAKQSAGYEGLPVLGALKSWKMFDPEILFINSLYRVRKMRHFLSIVESIKIPDERWATIVDPMATVCSNVQIGKGTFVGPGCVIEPASVIGERCALLGNVYVAHHSRLEDYIVCANSVSIAGGVRIGRGTYVGANATIHQYIEIGSFATIGMGSVVLNTAAEGETVVGNPAKSINVSGTQ